MKAEIWKAESGKVRRRKQGCNVYFLLSTFYFLLCLAASSAFAAAAIERVYARFNCTTGETLVDGDVVAIKAADGKCYKADADDSTLRPAVGVAWRSVPGTTASIVEVVTHGQVSGLSSLTTGAPVYLSTTAGGTTQTEPAAYSQALGTAISATQMTLALSAPAAVNDGAVTSQKLSLAVINKTGSEIATDKLVTLSGLDATSGKPKIVLADADVAAYDDLWITTGAIANNAAGSVVRAALSAANLNTNSATSAGDPVYLSTTAGAFAHTAPTGATARVHPVGWVVVKSATVGQIYWNTAQAARAIGTDELQALAVTAAKLAASAVETAKIADANVTSTKASTPLKTRSVIISLPDPGGADADITAGYVLWSPSVNATITKAYLIPEAAWVAAAAANDATVVITNAAVGAVATLSIVTALAAGSKNDMGTITNAAVVADTNVTIAVTANGTADSPRNSVQIEYITAD